MMSTLRLLADKHIYFLRELAPKAALVDVFDPDQGIPDNVGSYDALLVRTVTKVNARTVGSLGQLRWVGTASAGYDHLDVPWLKHHGVAVGFAAGCNARAVAEYVLTLALVIAKRKGWQIENERLGIVGVGFVGATVASMAQKLGIQVVAYDPPRAIRDPDFESDSLEELLDCEMLTFHTPLTESGPWATLGWLDHEKLLWRPRKLLVQASRGGVVDEQALLSALQTGRLDDAIVDVWQKEPLVNADLLKACAVGTPHIAGYSHRSKRLATEMALKHLEGCMLGAEPAFPEDSPRPYVARATKASMGDTVRSYGGEWLPDTLLDHFMNYDRWLRQSMDLGSDEERMREFRRLRTEIPYRDEYPDTDISVYPKGRWPMLDLFREL